MNSSLNNFPENFIGILSGSSISTDMIRELRVWRIFSMKGIMSLFVLDIMLKYRSNLLAVNVRYFFPWLQAYLEDFPW